MKNKKIILGLATVSTVIAPLATVISCGLGKEKKVKFPEEITGITFKGSQGHGSIDHEITPIIGVVITTDKDASITLTDGEAIIATYTLQKNYSWNDGTNDPKTLTTNVSGLANKTIAFPSTVEGLTFKGSQGHGSINHKVTKIDHVEITTNQDGSDTLSDGNEVVVTYKLEEDYYWADGTNDPKKNTIQVSGLKEKTVTAPTEVTGLTFKGANGHGSIKTPVTKIDNVKITTNQDGSDTLSDGNEVVVTYKLKEGYAWADGSTGVKTLTIKVQGLRNVNAFTGIWKSQKNKEKFLNLKNTDTITKDLFTNENNLTSLTIKKGKLPTTPFGEEDSLFGQNGLTKLTNLTLANITWTSIPYRCFASIKNVVNLDLSGCLKLESIEKHAFYEADKLINLNLSNTSIKTLGEQIKEYPFGKDNKIENLNLENCSKLTTINYFAFYNSKNLKTINFKGCTSLKTIGEYAFENAKLTTLDLSNCSSLTSIGNVAFENANLTTLDLSECINLENLGTANGVDTFRDSPLTSLKLPKSLKVINRGCFYLSLLTSLDLSNYTNLKTIGKWAFGTTPLTSLDLSNCNSLTSIGNAAFENARLTSLDLSGCINLTSIGDSAFKNAKLTTIKTSNLINLKTIGLSAFQNSRLNLKFLEELPALETMDWYAFISSHWTGRLNLSKCTNLKDLKPFSLGKGKQVTGWMSVKILNKWKTWNWDQIFHSGLIHTIYKIDETYSWVRSW